MLVTCPECGTKISETADPCPKCGCEDAGYNSQESKEKREKRVRVTQEDVEEAKRKFRNRGRG